MSYSVQPRTITRKELAAMSDGLISERTICDREVEWGLDKVKLRFSRRPIIYLRVPAVEILRRIQALVD